MSVPYFNPANADPVHQMDQKGGLDTTTTDGKGPVMRLVGLNASAGDTTGLHLDETQRAHQETLLHDKLG